MPVSSEHVLSFPDSFAFSLTQFAVSIGAMILLLTDIPRSGFMATSLAEYQRVAPNVFTVNGPWSYAIARINKTEDNVFEAACDGQSLDALDVWSYKFDTLSVPYRALAEHLKVTEFPDCIMYKSECGLTLAPRTVFGIVDSLVAAVLDQYFSNDRDNSGIARFMVICHWIDRVRDHFVGAPVQFPLYHVAHYGASDPRHVNPCLRLSRTHKLLPMCSFRYRWTADHPLNSELGPVRLWESIGIRMHDLETEHPELTFDLTVFTTQYLDTTRHATRFVWFPTVFVWDEYSEITTWIRGRRCRPEQPTVCETVLIDDYRYELGLLEHDTADWYNVVALLRGSGQLYMWIRVLLLMVGCYALQAPEMANASTHIKAWEALKVFVAVPFQTVAYGSAVPVGAYSVAYVIDCYMAHEYGDLVMASFKGEENFDMVQFFVQASVSLRTVWPLAVMARLLTLWQLRLWPEQGAVQRRGLWAIQEYAIVFIAALSMLMNYRSNSFRDTRVLQVFDPRVSSAPADRAFHKESVATFGILLDLKVLSTLLAILTACSMILRAVTTSRQRGGCRSPMYGQATTLPLTAGRLWPMTMLCGNTFDVAVSRRWSVSQVRPGSIIKSFRSASDFNGAAILRARATTRLMNVVMLTDPLEWIQLQWSDTDLRLYSKKGASSRILHQVWLRTTQQTNELNSQTVLELVRSNMILVLPCDVQSLWTSLGRGQRLVCTHVIKARDAPWAVIVECI